MYSMAIREALWNAGTLQLMMAFSFHFLSSRFASRIRFLFPSDKRQIRIPLFIDYNSDYGNEQFNHLETHHISLN